MYYCHYQKHKGCKVVVSISPFSLPLTSLRQTDELWQMLLGHHEPSQVIASFEAVVVDVLH